ncbi:hypothetical protein [Mycobacteroides abscessus]|uniref:hypothetical protein n=1 Tax=Mycobacteroides abscessus TaxID=36809 RepID=UPI0009A72D7D|nr:hypothetical protein [Mycobacteroides abscessus]SLH38951.1 putative secreted protein [Mycobacteroides abscessus subsp. massiliense]
MTDQVDEIVDILNDLRGLLGEGTPVSAPLPSTVPDDIKQRLDALPNGTGKVIENLVHERKSQAEIATELAKIDPSLEPVVERSAAEVLASRDQIDNAKDTYGVRKDQLEPIDNTAAGQMALLQAKADALTDGTSAVRGTVDSGELRRAAVDRLAQKYVQQAMATGGGAAQPAQQAAAGMGNQGGGGSGGGSPMSGAGQALSSSLGKAPAMAGTLASAAAAGGSGGGSGGGLAEPGTAERDVEGALPKGKADEKGLQVKTILLARAVSAAFPEITRIGGYRADSMHWHPDGLAIDVMIDNPNTPQGKALGDRVLKFVMSKQQQFGIDHAIWRQTIHIPGNSPRMMENRGSATQNHMDHVHIATSGGGYPRGGEIYAL